MRKLRLVTSGCARDRGLFWGHFGNHRDQTTNVQNADAEIDEAYVCCPYCGSELDWDKVRKPSQRFLRMLEKL